MRFLWRARSIAVKDGDTLLVVADLGHRITLECELRLAGLNTPESKTRRAAEKAAGLRAKSRLWQFVLAPTTGDWWVRSDQKPEKFGRVLGDALDATEHDAGLTVNRSAARTMLGEGWAREYWGEAKPEWTDEELARIAALPLPE